MKHSLDLYIVSNNQSVIDQLIAAAPAQEDETVWANGYKGITQSEDENGDHVLSGIVRFNEELSRDQAQVAIMGLAGMFALCEPRSYIRLHTCYHDETPPKPCAVTTLYEVVEE